MRFATILMGLGELIRMTSKISATYREHLSQKNIKAQLRTRDGSAGRYYTFKNGKLTSRRGLHPKPDCTMVFKDAAFGARLLTPPIDYLEQIEAQKNFNLTVEGDDDVVYWFAQTIMLTQNHHWSFGVDMPDGTKRYTNCTNGGPVFVYVKDKKCSLYRI